MNLFLLILFLLIDKISARSPRVNGGGCIQIKDELYYIGGSITLPNINIVPEMNKEILKLDFKKGVALYNNVVSWERYNATNAPEFFVGSMPFYTDNFNQKNTIINFYSGNYGTAINVHYFDIDKYEWYDKYLINEISYEPEIKSIKNHYAEYSILQSETNPKQFYISGYFYNVELKKDMTYQIKLFDIESREIQSIYKSPKETKFKLIFVLTDKLYYFEVIIKDGKENIVYNTLYELSLSTFEIISHKIPFRNYGEIRFVKVNQLMYFIGSDKYDDELTDVFKITSEPFTFNKVNEIVKIGTWGCFTNYKNYIINSFGLKFVDYRGGKLPESSDKTQMIDTQTWENVESLPPLLKGNTTTSNDSNDYVGNNNLGAIIGGSIGGIVGFLLLFGIFFIFYRSKLKKEKPPSIITDPIFINPNIHLDSNNNNNNSDIFSHSHIINENNTGLIENLNLNQIGNMAMINQESRSVNETILGHTGESNEDYTRVPPIM